ncbi:MAG: hypothetical protein ACYDCS_10915 [Candidatus Dormibacteria bacterium]
MNVGYAIVSLVGAVIVVDGVWMTASARFLLRIPPGTIRGTLRR